MSKSRRSPDTDARQLEIDFEAMLQAAEAARALQVPGGYAIDRQFVGLLNEAMRRALVAGKKAEAVAAGMRALLGYGQHDRCCSIHMLRNYLGESFDKQPYRLPAAWLAAFCAATEDDEPLRYLARVRGYELVPAEVLALAKIGEIRVRRNELTTEERQWMKRLDTLTGRGGGR